MPTECIQQAVLFQEAGDGRHVVARFDGGTLTSDGGALLLRETDQRIGLLSRFAACFTDHRDPARVTHSVETMVRQRVYGLAAGYEDLNDHEQLRHDPVFAVLAAAADLTAPLAGKSTLDRLELTPAVLGPGERYKKITLDHAAVDRLLVTVFLEAHPTPPPEIVLDLDDTDDPVHGAQEGRFFHGYYDEYCYLPLYIFAGAHLLCARLRPGNSHASTGALAEVERVVTQIRTAWPTVRITLRADSGFCGDALFTWCETHSVDYVIGLAKNARLLRAIGAELAAVTARGQATGQPTREFAELTYRTRRSWRCARRVVAKAEYLPGGDIGKRNPRFVVTSLSADGPTGLAAQALYETLYCARGDMENRIKEQQLGLFADRTSATTFRGNQLRLYCSSMAYVLVHALRRLALVGTELAEAQVTTIRLKLVKIGARVRLTARKVWVALASSYPHAALFIRIHQTLIALPLRC
jgi:hypothetical protein